MLSMIMLVEVLNPVINNMTEFALETVSETTVGDYEIICHVHGDADLELSKQFDNVRILRTNRQLSIAEGYNKAAKLATGELLCVLHNDIFISQHGWNFLLEYVARSRNIAFPMVNEEVGDCELRGVVKTEPWQTSSCCYMLHKTVWDKLGGLDEQFKGMHGEDIDFFRRCEQAGHRLIRCDPKVMHLRGVSRSFVPDRANKPFFDNWRKYVEKHNITPGEPHLPRLTETPEIVLEHVGGIVALNNYIQNHVGKGVGHD